MVVVVVVLGVNFFRVKVTMVYYLLKAVVVAAVMVLVFSNNGTDSDSDRSYMIPLYMTSYMNERSLSLSMRKSCRGC